jgi:NTP pyrophosphatase (non-canonical NTP hydrolase)
MVSRRLGTERSARCSARDLVASKRSLRVIGGHFGNRSPYAVVLRPLVVCLRPYRAPTTDLSFRMNKPFAQRIAAMNAMYKLAANDSPTLPADVADRLAKFKATLLDEVHEIDEIVALAKERGAPIDITVAIADLLGDIVVYCRSEALKYGLPLEEVLDIIMDSNESKLGADGKPIYDANGKFLKGPNYWKPEPKIRALLEKHSIVRTPDSRRTG